MKTTGQIGLALVAVIGLIAGVTYLSNYRQASNASDEAPFAVKPAEKPLEDLYLKFNDETIDWEPRTAGEFEVLSKNFRDFGFQNPTNKTVIFGAVGKNCRCTSLEMLAVDEAQLPLLQGWLFSSAGMLLAQSHQGILTTVGLLALETQPTPKFNGVEFHWQPVEIGEKESEGIRIPPKGGGLLRIQFNGKKEQVGAQLVKVQLWAKPEGGFDRQRSFSELDLPFKYIPTIEYGVDQLYLETLNAGDVRSGELLVFSKMRAGFDVHARLAEPDPLVGIEITDLTPEELEVTKKTEPRALAAKRVTIKVHERLSDGQRMDLGPFMRKLYLSPTGEEADETLIKIGGVILGEVVVGATEDRGRIDFKSFSAKLGGHRTIPVLANQPNLELDKVRIYPDSLQAHVKVRLDKQKPLSGQRNRWQLHVTLEPGLPPGTLPEGSAIYLNIAGVNPPQQIRVPIIGRAFQ